MTKFFLYRKQLSEGCDYTIGCGQKLSPLRADSFDDAVREATEIVGTNGGLGDNYGNDFVLDEAVVFAAPVHVVDLAALRAEVRSKAATEASATELARERAEFERLSKKFGGGQ